MTKDKMRNGIRWYGFIGPTTSTTDISLISMRRDTVYKKHNSLLHKLEVIAICYT